MRKTGKKYIRKAQLKWYKLAKYGTRVERDVRLVQGE